MTKEPTYGLIGYMAQGGTIRTMKKYILPYLLLSICIGLSYPNLLLHGDLTRTGPDYI